MSKVTGMWVYQALGARPDPDVVTARAATHHMTWITIQAVKDRDVLQAAVIEAEIRTR